AKDLAHQFNQATASRSPSWLVHLLEARELIAQRQTEQKLIRRKVQQLREERRGRPPAATQAQRQAWEADQLEQTAQAMAVTEAKDPDPRSHLLEILT